MPVCFFERGGCWWWWWWCCCCCCYRRRRRCCFLKRCSLVKNASVCSDCSRALAELVLFHLQCFAAWRHQPSDRHRLSVRICIGSTSIPNCPHAPAPSTARQRLQRDFKHTFPPPPPPPPASAHCIADSVRPLLPHTSHVTRHTSHVTRHTSHVLQGRFN